MKLALKHDPGEVETSWPFIDDVYEKCLSKKFLNNHRVWKVLVYCLWNLREINSHFCSKTKWHMFLFFSVRHLVAHPNGHQHGVSIQNYLNVGKIFLPISRIWKNVRNWILARILLISFHFPVFGPYLLNDFFIFSDLTLKTSNNREHFPFALQVVEATWMACLETFKSTDLSFLVRCDAIGKLEMQESAKLLHSYYYRNCICLTGECNIFMDSAAIYQCTIKSPNFVTIESFLSRLT